jgi:adapter protein MecA 1/2
MKIEKISDSQVKFVLNKNDLVERDIKITELSYRSEKTQDLFREMMEQASVECGFEAENTPLMIEAIPVTLDSIMIIVTKVSSHEDVESKFNLLPRAKDNGKFKKRAMLDTKENKAEKPGIYIYSFKNMDDVMNLCTRIVPVFGGDSSMYKYNDEYFIVLENCSPGEISSDFEALLNEYGQKHISGVINKYHLAEHGEVIVGISAVQILASIA